MVDNSIKWVLGLLDVDEEFDKNTDFSMEISPNPVESSSMIIYRFGGTHTANMKFVLYDNLGNKVSVINKDNVSPGEYQIPLNTEALSSGSYRLAGYVNGKVITIPVVITR
jgi:hypothetical protein